MGPRGQDMERLVIIALVAIVLGLALPAYTRVVRTASAGGAELSWLGHLGVFALTLVAAVAALALLLAAPWVAERIGQRLRRKPQPAPGCRPP